MYNPKLSLLGNKFEAVFTVSRKLQKHTVLESFIVTTGETIPSEMIPNADPFVGIH